MLERPPKPELGDFGFPMFPYAKLLRAAPAQVAGTLAAIVARDPEAAKLGAAVAEGPYLNVRLARGAEAASILAAASGDSWGRTGSLAGKRVLVEFSSPNTNKPLHLGHLRNNVLGESLSRTLGAAGAEVRKINHINDRGTHICKSMLAYLRYGEGRTPKDEGLKGRPLRRQVLCPLQQAQGGGPQGRGEGPGDARQVGEGAIPRSGLSGRR